MPTSTDDNMTRATSSDKISQSSFAISASLPLNSKVASNKLCAPAAKAILKIQDSPRHAPSFKANVICVLVAPSKQSCAASSA